MSWNDGWKGVKEFLEPHFCHFTRFYRASCFENWLNQLFFYEHFDELFLAFLTWSPMLWNCFQYGFSGIIFLDLFLVDLFLLQLISCIFSSGSPFFGLFYVSSSLLVLVCCVLAAPTFPFRVRRLRIGWLHSPRSATDPSLQTSVWSHSRGPSGPSGASGHAECSHFFVGPNGVSPVLVETDRSYWRSYEKLMAT